MSSSTSRLCVFPLSTPIFAPPNNATQNDNYAIANNVDASTLSKTMELPVVPTTDGDFYITFVDISDINTIYATSQTFTISLEGTPHSLTVQPSAGAPATTKNSSGSKSAPSSTTNTNVQVS